MKIKRKTGIKSIIPVSSMSDIAFLLLIFLMLTSILNMNKGPKIMTPEAKKVSTPQEAQKYEISVDKNGNYFFEGSYRELIDITNMLGERIISFPDMYIELNADQEAEYDMVDKVIKALQDIKCYQIVFVCKKITKEKST